jgi:hypothetical protein
VRLSGFDLEVNVESSHVWTSQGCACGGVSLRPVFVRLPAQRRVRSTRGRAYGAKLVGEIGFEPATPLVPNGKQALFDHLALPGTVHGVSGAPVFRTTADDGNTPLIRAAKWVGIETGFFNVMVTN